MKKTQSPRNATGNVFEPFKLFLSGAQQAGAKILRTKRTPIYWLTAPESASQLASLIGTAANYDGKALIVVERPRFKFDSTAKQLDFMVDSFPLGRLTKRVSRYVVIPVGFSFADVDRARKQVVKAINAYANRKANDGAMYSVPHFYAENDAVKRLDANNGPVGLRNLRFPASDCAGAQYIARCDHRAKIPHLIEAGKPLPSLSHSGVLYLIETVAKGKGKDRSLYHVYRRLGVTDYARMSGIKLNSSAVSVAARYLYWEISVASCPYAAEAIIRSLDKLPEV